MSAPIRVARNSFPVLVPWETSSTDPQANGGFKAQKIRIGTEPADLPSAHRRDHRPVPEFLPGMNVGKMDLHHRDLHSGNGVSQGNAGVSVRGGVEDHGVKWATRRLEPLHQLALMIGLTKFDDCIQFPGPLTHLVFNVGQGRTAIYLRLPCSQEVQVGAVQEKDIHRVQK